MQSNESEERLQLNVPLFEAPGARHGAAQGRPHSPKVWARRDQRLPGRSMRAERRDADRQAAAGSMTAAEQLAKMMSMVTSGELDLRNPTRKRQEMAHGATDFRWDYKTGEYVRYTPNDGERVVGRSGQIGWQDK